MNTASPNVYDPQKNTFIKTPEQRICPTCQQPLAPDVKPLTNHMNKYLNTISGKTLIVNNNDNIIEVQGVKLYKVTGQDNEGRPISSYVPATAGTTGEGRPLVGSSTDGKVAVDTTEGKAISSTASNASPNPKVIVTTTPAGNPPPTVPPQTIVKA